MSPTWEAKRIFFPADSDGAPAPWVADFLWELYAFPKAPHNNQVDAFTQLVKYMTQSPGSGLVQVVSKGTGEGES